MREFQRFEPDKDHVCYRMLFAEGEYVVVFDRPSPGETVIYSRTQYRNDRQTAYGILNEQVWSLAIGQAVDIVKALERLEIHAQGGLFGGANDDRVSTHDANYNDNAPSHTGCHDSDLSRRWRGEGGYVEPR